MTIPQIDILSRERASYGGFADMLGGLATIVLTIIGLSGFRPDLMLGIVTIIFGAALLIQGGTLLSEYAEFIFPEGEAVNSVNDFGGGSLSALFLAGAGGIVLGILALIGINAATLVPAAVIAFGSALVLSSNSIMNLHRLRSLSAGTATGLTRSGAEIVAAEMTTGSAGTQALAGLAAVVLGILALTGMNPPVLGLVALLALGGTLVLTGTTLSTLVMSFMRPTPAGRERVSTP